MLRAVRLDAERVCLRPLEARDLHDFMRLRASPEIARYTVRPVTTDEAVVQAHLDEIRAGVATGEFFQWGITVRGEDRVIGTVSIFELDQEQGRAELGYVLHPERWGHGLAEEAVRRAIRFAFEELKLRRLEADVDPRNTPSLALMDRLGFEREGYFRERWNVGGEIQDSILFGLLASRWVQGLPPPSPVRPMRAKDRARVLEMLAIQLSEHGITASPEAQASAVDGVFARADRGVFLVLDLGAGPIGFAYLAFTWTLETGGRTAWLEELWIEPAHREQGHGTRLLEAAIAEAKARGAQAMDLEIEAGHERVEHLYRRAGFGALRRSRWQRRGL
ncbi:MAG: GNAT family N-acetyltransferase [Myxococcota bacterium]